MKTDMSARNRLTEIVPESNSCKGTGTFSLLQSALHGWLHDMTRGRVDAGEKRMVFARFVCLFYTLKQTFDVL